MFSVQFFKKINCFLFAIEFNISKIGIILFMVLASFSLRPTFAL